jgi:hypothetical protein
MNRIVEIRNKLKKMGYSSRQINVRGGKCSSSIDIKIKDLSIDSDYIREIVSAFEKIHYDEYSGDILAGGNIFVRVSYDWRVLHDAAQKKLEYAKKIIEEGKALDFGRGKTVIDAGIYEIVYFPKPQYGIAEICLNKKPDDYKTLPCFALDTIKRYTAHNEYAISEALVLLENKINSLKKDAVLNEIFANDPQGILK